MANRFAFYISLLAIAGMLIIATLEIVFLKKNETILSSVSGFLGTVLGYWFGRYRGERQSRENT